MKAEFAFILKIGVVAGLFCCLQFPRFSFADNSEDGCYVRALRWIELVEGRNKDILQGHALSRCNFVQKWLERYEGKTDSARYKFCKDFVLLWTHKECNYFRDDVNQAAYEPCEAWSREMNEQCLEYNDAWFDS